MASVQVVDVADFIDRRQLSLFQVLVVAICFLIVAIDGFDATVMGFLASSIRTEWGLTPTQLAPLLAASLFGLLAGAIIFGPLSDRFGRKTILLLCVALLGAASLAASASPSPPMLIALRFLTGLGMGGAMPNCVTLTSEYCPQKHRLALVTAMYCGFAVGSALGGFASAHLVVAYGWRSPLAVGGVLPLALLPIAAWVLPESARFLALRSPADPRIVSALRRIAPREAIAPALYAHAEREPAAPIGRLFAPDLAFGTLMLWSTFFVSLLTIYLLSSWLPLILQSVGASLPASFVVTSMFQVGGTLGAILLGVLMDRFNSAYVLAISYAFGGALVATIGALPYSPILFGSIVFGAGLCISGCQIGVNAVAATFYPTDCRATGVGCAHGAGRLGAIVGSMAGAAVLSTGVSLAVAFAAIAMPTLFAAASLYALGRRRAGEGRALGVLRQPENYRTR
jgi:AAHS family 4-hydroxybenzoate transporter-like MFS transporter